MTHDESPNRLLMTPEGEALTLLREPRTRLDEMERYVWPGNICELRNVIGRTIVLDRDSIFKLLGPLEPEFNLAPPDRRAEDGDDESTRISKIGYASSNRNSSRENSRASEGSSRVSPFRLSNPFR